MSDIQQAILDALRSQGTLSERELRDATKRSRTGISTAIHQLYHAGRVSRRMIGRVYFWSTQDPAVDPRERIDDLNDAQRLVIDAIIGNGGSATKAQLEGVLKTPSHIRAALTFLVRSDLLTLDGSTYSYRWSVPTPDPTPVPVAVAVEAPAPTPPPIPDVVRVDDLDDEIAKAEQEVAHLKAKLAEASDLARKKKLQKLQTLIQERDALRAALEAEETRS